MICTVGILQDKNCRIGTPCFIRDRVAYYFNCGTGMIVARANFIVNFKSTFRFMDENDALKWFNKNVIIAEKSRIGEQKEFFNYIL